MDCAIKIPKRAQYKNFSNYPNLESHIGNYHACNGCRYTLTPFLALLKKEKN
jgi:hypothetical protein